MTGSSEFERLQTYLSLRAEGVKIKAHLGRGTDGAVWATNRYTAIKVFRASRINGYANERDTYLRLAEFGVTEKLAGFWVPKMHDWHDELMVVEMDLMQRAPYIIDFAKVRLNSPPDFSDEVLRETDERGTERFGKNWPEVQSLLDALASFLIFYLDPSPYNIVFPD